MRIAAALTLFALSSTAPALAQQTPQALFKAKCGLCHNDPAASNAARLGPGLQGVVGRKPGSAPFPRYSAAMKKITAPWTPASLSAYLAKPSKVVPGTTMAFAGMPDAAQREAIVRYLAAPR